MSHHLYLSLAIFLFFTTSNSVAQICDPYTASSDQYPGILTSLDVVQTSPIKLMATFRLINSTKTISFQGMLFGSGFGSDVAVTTCRSLGCSVANAASTISWTQKNECQFTCPDGTSAMQTCRFMQSYMKCPIDAMSLSECIQSPFWAYGSYSANQYGAANVICTECGP
jgi:hypothetical protein